MIAKTAGLTLLAACLGVVGAQPQGDHPPLLPETETRAPAAQRSRGATGLDAGLEQEFSIPSPYTDEDGSLRWEKYLLQARSGLCSDRNAALSMDGRFGLCRLEDEEDRLPSRLFEASVGLQGSITIDDILISLSARVGVASDLAKHEWDALQASAGLMFRVPLAESWSITPGLRFSTQAGQVPGGVSLRYVPLPALAVEYSPSRELSISLGFPSLRVHYQPSPLLDLSAAYQFPSGGGLEVRHEITPWFSVQESVGQSVSRYHLGDDQWPDEHELQWNSWFARCGAMFQFPLSGDAHAPHLTIELAYRFGLGESLDIRSVADRDTYLGLETEPTHAFSATLRIAFGGRGSSGQGRGRRR